MEIYRVSKKCFPDYKYLLKKTVEYKHTFFFKM